MKFSELFIDTIIFCCKFKRAAENAISVPMQGPGLFEPIHGSAPDIAGQVEMTSVSKISDTRILDGV